MKRRDFLFKTAVTSGLLFLNSCSFNKKTFINDYSKFLIADEDEDNKVTTLLVADTDGNFHFIPTPCKAHSLVVNPQRTHQVFGASKWGEDAYLADIKINKIIKDVVAEAGHYFYGHSLYSTDGRHIFVSMMNETNNQGYISIRNSESLKEVKKISTQGRQPHQIQWVKKDKIIAVINSTPLLTEKDQGHSVFCIINVETNELIKSFKTSIRRHSHFSLTDNQQTAIICRAGSPNDITLYESLDLKTGKVFMGRESLPLVGDRNESLSHILFEETSLAIMTIVGLNRLVFWDYKNNQVVFQKDFLDKPQGIALDNRGKNILISFYNKDKSYIQIFKKESFLKHDLTPHSTLTGAAGSHLTIV